MCNQNLVDFISLTLLVVLVILSAISSGSETALVSLNKIKVKTLYEQKRKGSKSLLKLKKEPKKLITTILIWNNLVNISAASLATSIAIEEFGSTGLGIATGFMTLTILIFGEIIPKSYATVNNERFALIIAKPIEIVMRIFSPITIPLMKLSDFVLGDSSRNINPTLTEEEIKTILDVGEQEKIIETHEKEYIRGVLKSGEITAREVMVPRKKMFVLDSKKNVSQSIDSMIKSGYTRAPLIDESKDNVVGIVHLKKLLSDQKKGKGEEGVIQISKKPLFVSQREVVGDLLRELQSKRMHMAIVLDEFEGVEGLLTLEDLVEEIVGEIIDESEDVSATIKRSDHNTIIASGETKIEEIERHFKIDFEKSEKHDFSNVNGILHDLLKDIPKKGDEIQTNGLLFVVDETENNVAKKVSITKV